MDVKKYQRDPFAVFGFVRISKMIFLILKLGFPRPSTLYPNFLFFKDRRFSMRYFSHLFSLKPPQFLLETKSFASIKDSFGFSALCDLPETFIKKFLEKISKKNLNFFYYFCFIYYLKMSTFFSTIFRTILNNSDILFGSDCKRGN